MPVSGTPIRSALAGLLALAALGSAGAVAQEQQPEASASHLAAAREAIAALHASEQFDLILPNAATQIKSELIVNNPNLQNEISAMVDDNAIELAPRRADLENEIARIYTRIYTEEELREIGRFYSSEAGRKLMEQQPLAMNEVMGAADIWANGIVRDLTATSTSEMLQMAPPAQPDAATPPVTPPAQ